MDDIYRAAGILAREWVYSIRKWADMLASDHLPRRLRRNEARLGPDGPRCGRAFQSDEVLRDASMRQSAINSLQSDQWEHFEEYWAAKAAENSHIQSELERVSALSIKTASNASRRKSPRKKVIFSKWQT